MKISELRPAPRDPANVRLVSVRVTEPTWETLSGMAEENGTTVSAVIRFILDRGLKTFRKDDKADCACMGNATKLRERIEQMRLSEESQIKSNR